MGPLMIDIPGLTLSDDDRKLLQHNAVAGVILFSRNYQDPIQLYDLMQQIRSASSQRLLITVDHEGGRVQRFKQGFTLIPPAQAYAKLRPIDEAKRLAFDAGWVLAMELMAFDIDLSFAPVLDLGHSCLAIGSRSFHQDRHIALQVAGAMIDGMHDAGMKTTGKHFPGHGAVLADSHKESPIDNRSQLLINDDMQIFADLIKMGKLDAVMPAHVIYPVFDDKPASGSPLWLQTILKQKLQFDGVIFSDDLSMEGAAFMGDYAQRANMAFNAGCDILLACNNRSATFTILDSLGHVTSDKPNTLLATNCIDYPTLIKSDQWRQRHRNLCKLNEEWQNSLYQ
ncbi:beta-N-acetylhexosaminidase [Orbus hercynius]|uniref:Beta-hexosaminidase n=1 Tax=Orbus hercynius TaxID=593135 RepID=A0A495RLM4_9GAMM|nr:beta-N-acetylhexosaminidase [Orbus hercynius]RKS87708.1 beta-N-acetylhexosaminidase [Orbus hercynius]